MAKERWQLQSLDSLRGIAILGVLLVHAAYWGPDRVLLTRSHLLNDILYSGQRGVQLFFLVSAFTLYMSHDNRRQERHPNRNFFLRRAFRITPMFYLATLLGLLFWRGAMGPPSHILLTLLYLNNFSPALITQGAPGSWSVSTEAAFYMLLPLGFRYIRSARAAASVVLVGAIFRHLIVSLDRTHTDYWWYMSLPANLSVFALGAMLYFLWKDHLRRRVGTADARGLSAAVLFVFCALLIEQPPRSPSILIFGGGLCFLLALALLLHPWKLFVNRYTIFLGNISFSFYLLHFEVMRPVQRLLLSYQAHHPTRLPVEAQIAADFVLTLLITGCLSAITWRYIEQPTIRLGKRLIERLESKHLPGLRPEEQF